MSLDNNDSVKAEPTSPTQVYVNCWCGHRGIVGKDIHEDRRIGYACRDCYQGLTDRRINADRIARRRHFV
ncbi:MAG: hypothetical protein ABH864_05570 [archaeon]